MALNDYSASQFLPETLRTWLGEPNKVHVYRDYNYLRIFDGQDLLATLNNKFASDVASGYTKANVSNLMSGIAPRLQQILVNKVVTKVDYTGYKECKEIENVVKKEYLTLKLKKSFNNAIRTGRDLLVLYATKDKLDEAKKHIEIQNVEAFRHKVNIVNEKVTDVLILIEQLRQKANCYLNIFEHRYYNRDGKPCYEYTLTKMEWTNDSYESTTTIIFDKDQARLLKESAPADDPIKNYDDFYKEIELPFTDLGCYHVDNTLYNSKYPYTNIPESRFVNLQDKVMEIENSITYKEIDKNIGRGRATIPSSFDFQKAMNIKGNASNMASMGAFSNPLDSTFFVQYQTGGGLDKAVAPQGIQFNIRADEWRTSLSGEIGDLCAAFGLTILDYDPRLLQAGQRTDDEINAMTDITASTVEELRTMNEYQINLMLDAIAKYIGYQTPLTIKWNLASIINPTKNQDLITKQLANGTISRKKAIARSNPDYTDDEVEEEYKVIESERGLSEANAVF